MAIFIGNIWGAILQLEHQVNAVQRINPPTKKKTALELEHTWVG